MKKYLYSLLVLLTAVLLVGCSGKSKSLDIDKVTQNTLLIKKDGKVQSVSVEDFDKEYYNKDELERFVKDACASYNTLNGKDKVTLKKVKVKNQVASVLTNFESLDVYNDFTFMDEDPIYIKELSVDEAQSNLDIPNELMEVDKEDKVTKEAVLSNDKIKIIVTTDNTQLRVSGKIKYYSNAIMLNSSSAQVGEDGVSVIIYTP